MVFGRQDCVDQHPWRVLEPDGPMVFAWPVGRAREHLGLQGDIGNFLAPAADARDPIVDDLQADELAAASDVLGTPNEDFPTSAGTPEVAG